MIEIDILNFTRRPLERSSSIYFWTITIKLKIPRMSKFVGRTSCITINNLLYSNYIDQVEAAASAR